MYKQRNTAKHGPLSDCVCEALRVRGHAANSQGGSEGWSALNLVHTLWHRCAPISTMCGPIGTRLERGTLWEEHMGSADVQRVASPSVQPAAGLEE